MQGLNLAKIDSYGDIYEQAVVKTVAGFFHGTSKHLFGVTRFRGATRFSSGQLHSF